MFRRTGLVPLILCLLFTAFSQVEAKSIVNRIVLQIRNQAYSQRELELYRAAKWSMRSPEPFVPLSASNWSQELASFSRDMLLFKEAWTTNRFQADESVINSNLEKIFQRVQSEPELSKLFQRLQGERVDLIELVAMEIQVENFQQSKKRTDRFSNADNDADYKSFIDSLASKYYVRPFVGADVYIELNPNA